jgi:ABC-2 type transport system ATP-binding protein
VRVIGTPERAERLLTEQPGVTSVHDTGDRLQFEFEGGDAEQVQLIARLVAAGIPVLEFTVHGADLEDLFIEITQGRVQ